VGAEALELVTDTTPEERWLLSQRCTRQQATGGSPRAADRGGLFEEAAAGDVGAVRRRVERGYEGDVSRGDAAGATPLHHAARHGQTAVVVELINAQVFHASTNPCPCECSGRGLLANVTEPMFWIPGLMRCS